MATLYANDAPANQARTPSRPFPELTGALKEKFPAGTDLSSLKRYVADLDGSCRQTKPGETACSLVESAGFCVRNSTIIQARTDAMDKIEHLDAYRLFEGC